MLYHCMETVTNVAARTSAAPTTLPAGNYFNYNGELVISYLNEDVPEVLWPLLLYCCRQNEDGSYEVLQPLPEEYTGSAHHFLGWPVPTDPPAPAPTEEMLP